MMNRIILYIILCSITCVCSHANVRVLSIGVSEYPETSGWNQLNAHNDVELMCGIFPNAILLENASATRAGIEAQLKALASNAAKGDTVIVHFSGHGQQIITTNSKDEADRVDEAIVPFDAAKRKAGGYIGQNHLTDDVFGKAIDNIRIAVGSDGLVIAMIDACHSDSMDKDADQSGDIYRGTDEIFGSESMSDTEISNLREAYHNQEETTLAKSSDMSDVIYLSACRSDQRNYEVVVGDKGYGSLTYYFCKAYRNKGIFDLPAFLTALYDGMKGDNTLQFHGQLPSIRNTIGWVAPTQVIPSPPEPPDVHGEINESYNQTVIWGIVAVAFTVIFIALWITRKKKK